MKYNKVEYGEYLKSKVLDKFPSIRRLEYEINKENVSLSFEHGSVPTQELNCFMTWLRFNDPVVQEANMLDKEQENYNIEVKGYLSLLLLVIISIFIITVLIII